MFNFYKNYKNISLSAKIRDVILGITVISFIILGITSYVISRTVDLRKQQRTTYSSVINAANILDSYENNLVEQFVNICGTEDFAKDVKLILSEPTEDILHTRNLQNVLNDLRYANYLVNSSLIVTKNGQKAYTLYSAPLVLSPDKLFPNSELSGIHEISWLPERNSPFTIKETIIPMVIPLKMIGDYLQIVASKDTEPDLYVVLLIDRSRLLNVLNASNPQADTTYLYLMNVNGIPLTHSSSLDYEELENRDTLPFLSSILNDAIDPDANNEELAAPATGQKLNLIRQHANISTIKTRNGDKHLLQYSSNTEYIVFHELNRPGLFVMARTHFPTFKTFVINYSPFFLPAFLVILSVLFAVSIFMSSYITKPIMKLVSIVNMIERNEYKEYVYFDTEDEVGTLLNAINHMYDVNLQQMNRIREDEKEKYKSELKILTEQINPHFLYNTLEEIQSEVIRGKKDTAGNMIQYLADYLRIGLSGGADLIPISNEIRHASAYINIMNQRFGQNVMFVHQIEPELTGRSILKTILQPLIENSIRHGFGIDANGIPVSVPSIEVNISSPEPHTLSIEIADNGGGFNTDEVRRIMTEPSHSGVRKHVGINNTWLRLISYYGEENVDLNLESIPYYRNSFMITIKNAF